MTVRGLSAFCLLLALTCAFAGCVLLAPRPIEPMDRWQRTLTSGPFSLLLPPSLEKQDVRGIDSIVGEYSSRRASLSFDYGLYSDRFEFRGQENYSDSLVSLDDKPARLVRYSEVVEGERSYVSAIHIPSLFFGPLGEETLSVWVDCPIQSDCHVLERALLSIDIDDDALEQRAALLNEQRTTDN